MKIYVAILCLAVSVYGQTTVSGSGGLSASSGITFSSAGTVVTPVTITTGCNPLAGGTETALYTQTFAAVNGSAPYSWLVVSGSLTGSGLTLNSAGVLSGTPPIGAAGTYSFGVQATDALGAQSSPASCQVTIQPTNIPPPSITTASLPNCTEGTTCSATLTVSGGTPPYTCAIVGGALPSGVTATGGCNPVYTGTVAIGAASGSPYGLDFTATDSTPTTSPTKSLTLAVVTQGPCNTSPGPPNYPCSRTDLANATPPSFIPNVGNLTGWGTIVTDPDFSSRIVRVSDTTALTGTPNITSFIADHGGSSDENLWNADSSMMVFAAEGGIAYPEAFNVEGTVNTSGTAVTWANGGQNFANIGSTTQIIINGTTYTIQSKNSNTSITLTSSAGTQTGVVYQVPTFQPYIIYPSVKPFRFSADPFWKRGSRTILHTATESGTSPIIQDYDFTDWLTGPQTTPPTPTTVIDFTAAVNGQHNCLPAGFVSLSNSVGGGTANDSIVMVYSSTSGQGTSGMVFLVAHVPGKGCAMWNTSTGAITTDPGFSGGTGLTCTANGCTGTVATTADKFTIHNVKVGLNNNWAVVTGTTCLSGSCITGFPGAPYFWNFTNPTQVGWSSQGGQFSGHFTTGSLNWINTPGTNHIWQKAIRTIGFNTTPSLMIPLADFPTMPTPVGVTESHLGYNNADPSDTFDVFWNTSVDPSGSVQNNWQALTVPTANGVNFEIDRRRPNNWWWADQFLGVYFSSDAGQHWAQVNTGLPVCNTHVLAGTLTYDAVHDQMIVGMEPGGNGTSGTSCNPSWWRTTNNGTSWTQIPKPTGFGGGVTSVPTPLGPVITPNGNLVFSATNAVGGTMGAFYSADGGVTTTLSSNIANGTCAAPGGSFSLYNDTLQGNVLAGSEQCGPYISTDNGATFNPCGPAETGFPGGIRDGNWNASIDDNAGNILGATQGGIWKSSGSACPYTWTNVLSNPNTSSGVTFGRDAKGNLYYGHGPDTTDTCAIYRSAAPNNGASGSWTQFCTGLPTVAGTGGTVGLVGKKFIQSPFDQLMYAMLRDGKLNQGYLFRTQIGSGDLSPYGWQNELLATNPTTGITSRFAHTYNLAQSQLFQVQIGTFSISQDGRYLLITSDWNGMLGSELGGAGCTYSLDCRGDVFVIELK